MGKQSGLGRGLGALIPPKSAGNAAPSATQTVVDDKPTVSGPPASARPTVSGAPGRAKTLNSALATAPLETKTGVAEIQIASIEANPRQPRRHFDHAMMDDLIASIKAHGVLQPILLTRQGNKYQLIAGERRLRAATLAGLTAIPAVVREASDQEKLELALIENIQRQDLSPIEEARAYDELQQSFGLTQEEIAKKVGKSRSQVSNTLRLLQLPEHMQQALLDGRLSASNARTLLALESDRERSQLFEAMIAGRYTVREAEEQVQAARARPRRPHDPNIRAAEEQIRMYLLCKVKIRRQEKGDGEIRLRFYSDEELQAILEKLKEG